MIPPTSAFCNLQCMYCFKALPCPECKTSSMDIDDATLQLFIRQKIDSQEADDVIFTWQGNEPTLDGFSFFNRVIELQQQFSHGKNIINTLLINGIPLDDRWCEFFKNNQFLISISVNVDTSLHNDVREMISNKLITHEAEESVRLLQKHGVEFNTLTVVDAMNSQQPLRIYHYLKNLGSRHMQFIPFLASVAHEGVDARSLAPAEWGTFLKTIFYTWIRLDIGTIDIPIFQHTFAAWCGLPVEHCIFSQSQNNASTLRTNDGLDQYDRFVNSNPLLAAECASCKVKFVCHGGCPKDCIILSQRGVPELNYFCESYLAFFTYVEPYMLMMKALWEQNYAPSDIRQYLA